MAEMKTLNGYEVVDAKAREEIEALKENSGGGGGGQSWSTTYNPSKPIYAVELESFEFQGNNYETILHPYGDVFHRHIETEKFTYHTDIDEYSSDWAFINPLVELKFTSDGQLQSEPIISGLSINLDTLELRRDLVGRMFSLEWNEDEQDYTNEVAPRVVKWLQ